MALSLVLAGQPIEVQARVGMRQEGRHGEEVEGASLVPQGAAIAGTPIECWY